MSEENPFLPASPVTQPAPMMPPSNPRPTALLVLGIINIIYGLFGVCGSVGSVINLYLEAFGPPAAAQNPMAKLMEDNVFFKIITMGQVGTGFLFSMLLVIAGVMLINVNPRGRTLSIAYVVYSFVYLILAIITLTMMYGPMRENFVAQGMPPETVGIVLFIGFGLGACLGVLYPCILLFFMFRPSIVQALNAQKEI